MVIEGGQGFASGKERDSARALPADPLQHRVVVALTDAQVAGDDLALALFWQNPGEVSPAFLARKPLLPQRQRVGQGRGVRPLQPAFRVVKDHLAAVILNQVADQFSVQVDIQVFAMCYSSLPETAGGVSAILIPSVCRTVSTLPIWQVSLPFSRSMTKRRPVPEVSAKSFCVTPNRFRLSRTSWPISCTVYFTGSP
jgi:hypothetical protein